MPGISPPCCPGSFYKCGHGGWWNSGLQFSQGLVPKQMLEC